MTMTTQLSERNLPGVIAFFASGVRSPHLDWNGMYDHYEVEYHLEPLASRLILSQHPCNVRVHPAFRANRRMRAIGH